MRILLLFFYFFFLLKKKRTSQTDHMIHKLSQAFPNKVIYDKPPYLNVYAHKKKT